MIVILPGIGSIVTDVSDKIDQTYLIYARSKCDWTTDFVVSYHIMYLMTVFHQINISDCFQKNIFVGHSLGQLLSIYCAGGCDWKEIIDIAIEYDFCFQNVINKFPNAGLVFDQTDTPACKNSPSSYIYISSDVSSQRVLSNIPFHDSCIAEYVNIPNRVFRTKYKILTENGLVNEISTNDITKMLCSFFDFSSIIELYLGEEFIEISIKPTILPILLEWNKDLKVIGMSNKENIYEYVKKYIMTQYNQIDENRTFRDYGLKSIDFVRLVGMINTDLKLNLPNVYFYKFPTLHSLKVSSDVSIASEMANSSFFINGISIDLPNCDSLDGLWNILSESKTTTHKLTSTISNHHNIPDVEFNNMSTEQKVLLQNTHYAIIDSGMDLQNKNVGVFIGYWNTTGIQNTGSAYDATNTAATILASRISYLYNFSGPSLVIDTACSSSLVALHTAINSLRCGDCEYAIVGGVNIVRDQMTDIMKQGGYLSKDFCCHTFSNEANGYVRSEGCVVLIISKQSKDCYGEILSTFINQDGKSNGLTAPNPVAQVNLIKNCISRSKLDKSSITYYECHGTGTALGDPIEVDSLYDVFGKQELVLGSIKSYIGHTEACAGLVGLMSLLVTLQNGVRPKSVPIREKNKFIDWDKMNFKLTNDKAANVGNIGMVSSFGYGGTNSCCMLKGFKRQTHYINIDEYSGHKLFGKNTFPACGWVEYYMGKKSFEIEFKRLIQESTGFINPYQMVSANSHPNDIDVVSSYSLFMDKESFYTKCADHGLEYSGNFYINDKVYCNKNSYKIEFDTPKELNQYTLDGGIQPLVSLISNKTFIPSKIRFDLKSKLVCTSVYATIDDYNMDSTMISATVYYYNGSTIIAILSIELKPIQYSSKNSKYVHQFSLKNSKLSDSMVDEALEIIRTKKYRDSKLNIGGLLKTIQLEDPSFEYNYDEPKLGEIDIEYEYTVKNNSLQRIPKYIRPLRDDELLIQVCYTGLNFRDSLNVLGMYPGDPGKIGIEFSGIVLQSNAEDYVPNDIVMGVSFGTYTSHTIIHKNLVRKHQMSHKFAASLPLVAITVEYALKNLRSTDKVLIHAGCGGVGLYAIEYCKRILPMQNIFTTVSSQEKREHLISIGILPTNIQSSRTNEFSKVWSNMNVILNSIAFVEDSLKCLSDDGILYELGKRTLVNNEKIIPIAMDDFMRAKSPIVSELLQKSNLYEIPVQITENLSDGLKLLQSGKLIGKLVYCISNHTNKRNSFSIITGSTGGLGQELCRYFDKINHNYYCLTRDDISCKDKLINTLNEIRKKHQITGIYHLAGCLDDGIAGNQTKEKFENVLYPKYTVCKYLDELTRNDPIVRFVAYSSITSFFGSMGQSNYVFANSMIDSLIQNRIRDGLPGLSLLWTVWDTGMGSVVTDHFKKMGIETIEKEHAMKIFHKIETFNGLYVIGKFKKIDTQINCYTFNTKQEVIEQIENILYKMTNKKINHNSSLMDEGIDSLLSIDFKNTIQQSFGVNVINTMLFDYPTMDKIANYIFKMVHKNDQNKISYIINNEGRFDNLTIEKAGIGKIEYVGVIDQFEFNNDDIEISTDGVKLKKFYNKNSGLNNPAIVTIYNAIEPENNLRDASIIRNNLNNIFQSSDKILLEYEHFSGRIKYFTKQIDNNFV